MNSEEITNRPILNLPLFTQSNVSSDSLTSKCSIVFQLPISGAYELVVYLDQEVRGKMNIAVTNEAAQHTLTLDLFTLDSTRKGRKDGAGQLQLVRPKGWILANVSQGSGGYYFLVMSVKNREVVFDSRTLQPGNSFSICLLQPGRYTLLNKISGLRANLDVRLSTSESRVDSRRIQNLPILIRATDTGFEPASVELNPGQGLVVRIATIALISCNLDEPFATQSPKSLSIPEIIELIKAKRTRTKGITP